MARRHVYTESRLRATETRIGALRALINAPKEGLDLTLINNEAGFSDNRVLLLSLAEMSINGLCELAEGKARITEHGRAFYYEYAPTTEDRRKTRHKPIIEEC